ncbi:MAG: DeoR family transcriptional regulator, partial [Candidatus Aenigmatarchaeota archaeon]
NKQKREERVNIPIMIQCNLYSFKEYEDCYFLLSSDRKLSEVPKKITNKLLGKPVFLKTLNIKKNDAYCGLDIAAAYKDLREKGLNERQIEVLREMVNREREITNKEYRERFDISKATAYRDLKELVERGFIESGGEGRSKHYSAQ